MLHSQQIIERSVYSAILNVLLQKGLTLNPEDYLPISVANTNRYKSDRAAIEKDGTYIELYGASDSLSKGPKHTPRIVISPQGFYPGDIGFEKTEMDEDEEGFLVSELPFEAVDQFIDIRLVANDIQESRLLHNVVNTGIPQRGYIKPYNLDNKPFSGNIFIMIVNYFNNDNSEHGIIEKTYQFTIKDTLLSEPNPVDSIVPMVDISFLIGEQDEIHKTNNNH